VKSYLKNWRYFLVNWSIFIMATVIAALVVAGILILAKLSRPKAPVFLRDIQGELDALPKTPAVPPAPVAPEPTWPGDASEYEVMRYRTNHFRVIEARIRVKAMADLNAAIQSERNGNYPGRLLRHRSGAKVQEIAKWKRE
jgi:hypothetical protein